MSEERSTVVLLRSTDQLREAAIDLAVRTLCLPAGSHGLDAGCGIGSHIGLLLSATSPGGRLTCLDSSGIHLAEALEKAGGMGLPGQVSFRCGDVKDLPFEADSFDWAWSVDCVGFIFGFFTYSLFSGVVQGR